MWFIVWVDSDRQQQVGEIRKYFRNYFDHWELSTFQSLKKKECISY